MSTLVISQQEIAQDIKPNSKKNQKVELNKNSDLFGTLISNLLKEENPDNSSNFLINKIVDKSNNFEKEDNLISDFSKGSLQDNSHEIGHITIQELLEIAIRLKKGEELPNFPTDSKPLKIALSSPLAIEEFKSATNINDLLKIAEKHDIKVKNFQFFKEEVALLPKDKKVLSDITSEDIFKLIDKKIPTEKLTQALVEKKNEPPKEVSLLQNFLFGKSETKKEIKTKNSGSFSHESIQDVKKETLKEVKTINQKENLTEKVKNIDQKTDIKNQPKDIQSIHENKKTIDQKINITEEIKNIDQKIEIKNQPKDIQPIHENKKTIDQKVNITEEIKNIDQKTEIKNRPKDIHPIHENKKTIDQKINITEEIKNIDPKVDIKNRPKNIQNLNEPKNQYNIIKTITQQIKNIKANLPLKIERGKQGRDRPIQSNNIAKNELLQKIQHSQILSKNIITEPQIKDNRQPIPIKESNKTVEEIQRGDKNQEFKTEESSTLIHQIKGEKVEKGNFTQNIKRTFNTFAQDFKEQVDNYKAPLMKIKMQLNPKNMGDVDVTLINRGNNLHVNIQANSNTLAMFLQHHVEFKNSLINMGFSALQMNFGEHNRDRQNEQQRRGNSKNSFESEELENREIDDINLIIPRYI